MDAMSLDVARHRWNARIDSRRRTYGIGIYSHGIYSHLLDQGWVIYDQPVVLGRRQTGAAIEGTVRQNAAELIDRLAVDTQSSFFVAGARKP